MRGICGVRGCAPRGGFAAVLAALMCALAAADSIAGLHLRSRRGRVESHCLRWTAGVEFHSLCHSLCEAAGAGSGLCPVVAVTGRGKVEGGGLYEPC
jgi:hypothetical protein